MGSINTVATNRKYQLKGECGAGKALKAFARQNARLAAMRMKNVSYEPLETTLSAGTFATLAGSIDAWVVFVVIYSSTSVRVV